MSASDRAYEALAKSLAAVRPAVFSTRLRKPHFFVGCGRSGTTLLARILATHPCIAVYPYEANELWHPGAFPWYRSKRDTRPIWIEPYVFTAASLACRTDRDDMRLRAVFGAYQYVKGGRCFVNKSVMVTFMIDHILRIFPGARFLHLCRDGRAVALSFARKEHTLITRHPSPYERSGVRYPLDQLLDAFSTHWKDHILELERQKRVGVLSRENFYELQYEEFCREPHTTLREIGAFLNVDHTGFDVNSFLPIINRNRKYENLLDKGTIRRLSGLMEPALNLKGYEIVDAT